MARYLYVKGGLVRNIVDYGFVPPAQSDAGEDIVPSVTGTENVGDAFDASNAKRDSQYSGMDAVMVKELFRLTNAVRVLQSQAPLTAPQYAAFLKSLMP